MQSDKIRNWSDLENSITLSNLYACAYSDFISNMEGAKINGKKNIGMYTKLFKDYENILFERKHKMSSWRSDKFRSLSQPLIDIIKRNVNISNTIDLKRVIDSADFRKLIGNHIVFKTYDDILSFIGLLGISEYYRYEIRKFKKVKNWDIKKTKDKMKKLDNSFISFIKIPDSRLRREYADNVNKYFNNVDVDTLRALMTLYPDYKYILTGVKYSLLYYLSLTK